MRPDVSVAMIFKNEIRCLERCLTSLQPLRERLSCEVVMADTGATDGSRAIAERYADVVFDFPWINDFSAARNAVLERCTGRWALTIDCDEWLDGVPEEFVSFVLGRTSGQYEFAGVIQRNYISEDVSQYEDVLVARAMRLDAKPRYRGAIHEMPFAEGQERTAVLSKTILHHDGYVMLNNGSEEGKAKAARNAELLYEELEKDPDDLRRLLQYLESAAEREDYYATLRHAVALVIKQQTGWKAFGAAILRQAVYDAYAKGLREKDDWLKKMQNLFPKSYFLHIDIAFLLFAQAFFGGDQKKTIAYGEEYLSAREAFQNDPNGFTETSASCLLRNNEYWEKYVRLRLAGAYQVGGQTDRALELLKQTDWTMLDGETTRFCIRVLRGLAGKGIDIGPLLGACWKGIQQPVPSAEQANERMAAFQQMVGVEDLPPEQAKAAAGKELLRLAEQVKAILKRFPPDDPAVAELKRSEVYQKVAYLIEEE